jgi:hypothetical protein
MQLKTKTDDYEHSLVEKQEECERKIENLTNSFKTDADTYELRNSELVRLTNDLRQQIDKLQQDTKDDIDNKKLQDKKQAQVLKDLKRQLNMEKKRADKLQDKLAELTISGCNMVDIKFGFDSDLNDDQSSVSRRSGGRNGVDTASITSSYNNMHESTMVSRTNGSPTSSIKNSHSTTIDIEHKQILDKLAQIQEANWKLEEKVSHLETANAAMAQDLMNKTAIISYYYLDKKMCGNSTVHQANAVTSNFKSIMADLLNNKSNQGQTNGTLTGFINSISGNTESDDVRKLRRLLEETLTKNMHLEQVTGFFYLLLPFLFGMYLIAKYF